MEVIPYLIFKIFGAIYNFIFSPVSGDVLMAVLLYHFFSKD